MWVWFFVYIASKMRSLRHGSRSVTCNTTSVGVASFFAGFLSARQSAGFVNILHYR